MLKRFFGAIAALAAIALHQPETFNPINPFPNGRFRFHGKLNGASRRRKSNRLHLSTKTRNKNR